MAADSHRPSLLPRPPARSPGPAGGLDTAKGLSVTAPSAPAPGPRPDERQFLQALTNDPEQRVIVSVMSRLTSWRRADRARPWVRRWGVPVLCFAGGSDAYLNPYNVSDPQLPIILAFCLPLLWRERHPMLVFALTTAVSIVSLPLGVLTGAEFARMVALFNVGRHCPRACWPPPPASPSSNSSHGPTSSGADTSWSTSRVRSP